MAAEAERLLQGSGWLPKPLRIADAAVDPADREEDLDSNDSDAPAEALPEFLTTGEGAAEPAKA